MTTLLTNFTVPNAPQSLDVLRFPLAGRSLIEASAGTGKTFTIAMLYVRLVLGHDSAGGDAQAYTPPEILVVTFTDAATKELRDRIRARLARAAVVFQAGPGFSEADDDALLVELRNEYPQQAWPDCALRLRLAAQWMDEAAVSTIHAWCSRMLREHAFDSGSLFEQTLETDGREVFAEVVRDYWRTFMMPLDEGDAETIGGWPSTRTNKKLVSPQELEKLLRGLVGNASLLPEAPPPAEALAQARAEQARRIAQIKAAPWTRWCAEMTALLDEARREGHFFPRSLQKGHCDRWLKMAEDWAAGSSQDPIDSKVLKNLCRTKLNEACVDNAPRPWHPGFAALETLKAEIDRLSTVREAVLAHAAHWVAARIDVEQARRAQMGYDDLLTRLADALAGPNGAQLADAMAAQFPVALIDEFQDTDPVQYRIFDAVYARRDASLRRALILIGDPKQAIYSFRGADIHTYLRARRACGDQLYTLATNYRSTPAMVAAVNHCFETAEARAKEGAFLFRQGDTHPVPFVGVKAKGRDDRLVGAAPAALTFYCLPEEFKNKTDYLDEMAQHCAAEIVRLLNRGANDEVAFIDQKGRQPLKPKHIAVLVNTGEEASKIRAALAARNVRTAYLSDKSSVFERPVALDLQHWLAACAEPDDARLVRTALATGTLGLGWAELDARYTDETAWEACVQQFRGYRDCWRQQGVLPMLRRLMRDYGVPARLLGIARGTAGNAAGEVTGGERILTDLLHLAELLQQASTMIEGHHALIRYLAAHRAKVGTQDGEIDTDALQTRLESDGDLVKVVTIHKSKGLEYPLVFVPFACAFRAAKAHDMPLKWHDEEGNLVVALNDGGGAREKADRERLAEDVRKLYVALTRARHATWVGVAPVEEYSRSAIGHLLDGAQPPTSPALLDRPAAAQDASPAIEIVPARAPSHDRFNPRDERTDKGSARTSRQVARESWWIASYSHLKTRGQHGSDNSMEHGPDAPESPAEQAGDEAREAERETEREEVQAPMRVASADLSSETSQDSVLHSFPSSSSRGNFLHDLLEWAARHGFARVAAAPQGDREADALHDAIERRCRARGWEESIEPLTGWVRQILSAKLTLPPIEGTEPASVRLSELKTSIAEMEFWFAATSVNTRRLDKLVCDHTLGGERRPALAGAVLNGMLKGFIDLVFVHEGRYYVADYKSNKLGDDDASYTAQAMRKKILDSRYELQYVLYLLALHRLLKARLHDYDYDRHVGGAVYLFLRGLNGPAGGVHTERPPRALIESLDALFSCEAAPQSVAAEVA
jgi:exodeoxyribonuclease V beta subunit